VVICSRFIVQECRRLRRRAVPDQLVVGRVQRSSNHRRTSQGDRGAASQRAALQPPPPDSDKTIIFQAKAKFFGQKPAAKNERKTFFCSY